MTAMIADVSVTTSIMTIVQLAGETCHARSQARQYLHSWNLAPN
jgi:hypothetical protein